MGTPAWSKWKFGSLMCHRTYLCLGDRKIRSKPWIGMWTEVYIFCCWALELCQRRVQISDPSKGRAFVHRDHDPKNLWLIICSKIRRWQTAIVQLDISAPCGDKCNENCNSSDDFCCTTPSQKYFRMLEKANAEARWAKTTEFWLSHCVQRWGKWMLVQYIVASLLSSVNLI